MASVTSFLLPSYHVLPLQNPNRILCLPLYSQFVFAKPISKFKRGSLFLKKRRTQTHVAVVTAQLNLFKVLQTVWKVGKDGIEAGTNLVPDSVPRPVARVSVAVVALTVSIIVLKSILSTAFFVLAMMGFIYFLFIAFNKDEGPRGGGGSGGDTPSTDDPLEEAARIMDKYK